MSPEVKYEIFRIGKATTEGEGQTSYRMPRRLYVSVGVIGVEGGPSFGAPGTFPSLCKVDKIDIIGQSIRSTRLAD